MSKTIELTLSQMIQKNMFPVTYECGFKIVKVPYHIFKKENEDPYSKRWHLSDYQPDFLYSEMARNKKTMLDGWDEE
jgi:hypothetical protein